MVLSVAAMSLPVPVGVIVSLCPKKKLRWVYTGRVIISMADTYTLGYIPNKHSISHSVCFYLALPIAKLPVTAPETSSAPVQQPVVIFLAILQKPNKCFYVFRSGFYVFCFPIKL